MSAPVRQEPVSWRAVGKAPEIEIAAIKGCLEVPDSTSSDRICNVHQAYELWFKQVLHEFDRIEKDFSTNPVNDGAMARIVHSLARIHEILKLLVAQLDVLETMTPADFLDFRDYLFPASGFQSLQFRLIETRLGLQESARVQLDGEAVENRLSVADRQKLAAARTRPTVLALLDIWLARTPFLDWGGELSGWPIGRRLCGTLRPPLGHVIGRLDPSSPRSASR
jgi:tryptophan 2,3-dioxygenase